MSFIKLSFPHFSNAQEKPKPGHCLNALLQRHGLISEISEEWKWMIFLELESYIEPPLGFPGHPYFTSDLWPLILSRSDEVRTVLWFQHEPPLNQAGVRESYLTDLGPLANQSDQTMEM